MHGSSSFILQSKLRKAKKLIKQRAVLKQKDKSNTKELESLLAKVDEKAAGSGWSDTLRKERLDFLSKLWVEIKREEPEWRQKSRVKWLLEEDRNTKFFHLVVSGGRRINFIDKIEINGECLSTLKDIQNGVSIFF